MKGFECKLLYFMQGPTTHFAIPVYQRNYDWKAEQCRQLYDDLVRVVRKGKRSHFFGSIVSTFNPEGQAQEFLIIDGQQRLTTVSLLLLALCRLLESGVVRSATPTLDRQILENFLIDKWQSGEQRLRLKPSGKDWESYHRLFDEPAEPIPASRLTVNYNYFQERIQKQEITADELYGALGKLEIINIVLNGEDEPQLIFESLNSTGMDLTEGDKIRNYVLMGLPPKEQETYYDKYWSPIEKCTRGDVSAFIRDCLSARQQLIPAQSRIYARFKSYVEDAGPDTEALLQKLLAWARRYGKLLGGGTGSEALDGCIDRLNRLETTVTRPFFLEVLRLQEEGILSLSQVTEIFRITESYLFRRTICALPGNLLNKLFAALHREIVHLDGTTDNYVEKFKYVLLSKRERSRFPGDGEFGQAFVERQVYMMSSKNRIYILERLENHDTDESKDVYAHIDNGTYTIEHIMPQQLTPVWIQELGEDCEQIHEVWLHRIANLTLTAYNAQYSNKSFAEKKRMKHGYGDSGIRLNAYLAKQERWTRAELEARSEHLRREALRIWERPESTFRPAAKPFDSISLAEADGLHGRSIVRFHYKNAAQTVHTWVEMYQKVLQLLYAQDKAIISRLADATQGALCIHFSRNPQDYYHCKEVGDGIYVWTGTDTPYKISVLQHLFELYDEDPADLVFELREKVDAERDAG